MIPHGPLPAGLFTLLVASLFAYGVYRLEDRRRPYSHHLAAATGGLALGLSLLLLT